MPNVEDDALTELKVPRAMRPRAVEIIQITDQVCASHLDHEYGQLCRMLVARLARKRPSPLARGDARNWAAAAIYAIGQINFLFDPAEQLHLTTDQLAHHLGVVKTTMANKAGLINKTLDLGMYEPDLSRAELLDEHPMTWIVQVNGILIDARTLPWEIQDEARRRGLITDLHAQRAA